MDNLLNPHIIVTPDGDEIPLDINSDDPSHHLKVSTGKENNYVYLEFSSRIALYDFARELLRLAVFGGGGQAEFRSQNFTGVLEILNGVRMTEDSPRLFVSYSPD
ncbi:hypothetical protein [Thiofilum flexile]|uniref:hypothetical protein n=1 Tax=Thiofilum flexile TaxID=125627 RepID=UPI00036BECB6|nr:hypothetical protein [Thiofilum flexile]